VLVLKTIFKGLKQLIMNALSITNIAAYKFVNLSSLEQEQTQLLSLCEQFQLKGTILLSYEGINLILAGATFDVEKFITELQKDERFADMEFKKSLSSKAPFRRLRVRIKKEIVTIKDSSVKPLEKTGAYLPATELKMWLEQNKDFILLDTRNDYEMEIGAFKKAVGLPIRYFSEFPEAIEKAELPKDKPIVMYCTGGIRCEKASNVMLKAGYKNVYQLQGGILKYFDECGDAHYRGDCFVFDERTAITPRFEETGLTQCPHCRTFIKADEQHHPDFVAWKKCQHCAGTVKKIA
jgi:UPF0176 protein